MNKIIISDGQMSLKFSIDYCNDDGKGKKIGTISIEMIKKYFKNAQGLTYQDDDGSTVAVEITQDDLLILPDSIFNYYVFPKNDKSDQVNETNSVKRRKKIAEFLDKYKKEKELEDEPSSSKVKTKNVDTTKHETVKALLPKKPKNRKINLGLMEFTSYTYKQIKGSLGGIKEVILDDSKLYSVEEIIQMGVNEFTSDSRLKDYFANSEICLGFYDGSPIKNFEVNSTPCGLWDYCKFYNYYLNRRNMYLLVKKKDIFNYEDTSKAEANVLNKYDEDSENFEIENFEIKRLSDEVENLKVSNENKFDIDFYKECSQFEEDCKKLKKQQQNGTIYMGFASIKKSKYSKQPIITLLDKQAAFERIKLDDPDLDVSQFAFNPQEYGFILCEIIVEGAVLFQIQFNEDETMTYCYPQVQNLEDVDTHTVLYDKDVFHGFCEGQWGIGVIPYCKQEKCNNLLITWYLNGEFYREGYSLFWLTDEIVNDTQDVDIWSYTITCDCNNI